MDRRAEDRIPASTTSLRLAFLDALRGIALILMVVNHTSRWWIDVSMGWPRYWLVYGSVLLPAPIFLFLVGYCLPIPLRRTPGAPLPSFAATMPRYLRRGVGVILGGLLLNVLVFPEDSVWSGGVLQTIGLAIIVVAPAAWIADRAWGRVTLLAAAVLAYLAFALAFPALRVWSTEHPAIAKAVLLDFPPWPWIAAAVIGLVLGWRWLDARARGEGAERRHFGVIAIVGLACFAAYGAWEWWLPTTPRFGWPRDFMLNRHWTPRGVTNFLVTGGVALLLSGGYWLAEVRRLRLTWLVTLGRTALMLYFVHQVIALTLVKQWLGWSTRSWLTYWTANVAFVIVLLGLGKAWLVLRPRLPRWRSRPATAPGTIG